MEEIVSTTDLVAAAAAGARDAWNELVRRYLPLVRSVTGAYRLSGSDAEDVCQTVWLRLVEHLGSIREPRALPKWIITTTRNESVRVIKARARALPVDPLGDQTFDAVADRREIDNDLLRAERLQALRDGLAELAGQQRRLLLLLIADPPLSYREIAARLDIPIGSIGPTRARCLERLRATDALSVFLVERGESDPATADPTTPHGGGDRHDLTRVGRPR